MKYAIIADIHANLPALQAVLADIKTQNCTKILCLGDIVGYNFQPKQCLDLIRSLGIPCLRGNHDEYCSSDVALDGFNPKAAEAVQWTRDQLTADDKTWLRNLPYTMVISGFTIVHATLNRPEHWGYVFDKLAAEEHFKRQTTPVCFFGHTHVPLAFIRDSMVRGGTFSEFKVERGPKYFVNVGSVGQPRDNNPKAAYVTYHLDTGQIELRRLDYPKPGPGPEGGIPSPLSGPPTRGPSFSGGCEQSEPSREPPTSP